MISPLLSIVIPAYNEESRLSGTLERVRSYIHERCPDYEILVVDDGSSDGTAGLVEAQAETQKRLRLLRNQRNRGKGYTVRRGMLAARGKLALLTDADLSTPIEEFEKLAAFVVEDGYQIAIGSRDLQDSRVEVHQSRIRENSGKLYNWLIRKFLSLPFRDTQCGFKLFDMKACRPVFERVRVRKYSFDVEVLVLAREMGLAVKEVPVVWRHHSESKVEFLRDGTRMILDLAGIWFKKVTGVYRR